MRTSQPKKNKRIAIIGAGPSGLFCAFKLTKLAKKNLDISIYEQGPLYSQRKCLIQNNIGDCSACSTCSCISGMGGSSMFHNMRLSLAPAGSGLRKILSNRYLLREKESLTTWSNSITNNDNFLKPDYYQKNHHTDYLSIPLSQPNVKQVFFSLFKQIKSNAHIYTNCYVDHILNKKGQWEIKSNRGIDLFDIVIVATGKHSRDFLLKTLEKNNIKTISPYFEFGFRVEFPHYPKSAIQNLPLDYKLKTSINNFSSARTYCWNYPGESICVNHNRLLCLDGQTSNTFKSRLSFAILVRDFSYSLKQINTFLQHLYKVQSTQYKGFPIGQSLSSFLKVTSSNIRFPKQKFPFLKGDLARLFNNKHINLLQEACNKLKINKMSGSTKAIILGPCIEKTTPRPVLQNNHESSLKNLYFIGDCTGRYRGSLQASIAGQDLAVQLGQLI